MDRFLLLVSLLLLSVHLANARFSAGFHRFLTLQYGAKVAEQMERMDLGSNRAFGGGNSSVLMVLTHDPIVLVHGDIQTAANVLQNAQFFESHGFQKGSVFATTWGPNGTKMSPDQTLHCDYVKQIRRLILSVHRYTQRPVIVSAVSLGSAISRKALLGGRCVDTKENLGAPLTAIVRVFFSLAGVNKGGRHYEAQHVYVAASRQDAAVTYPYIQISGADINVTLSGFTHGTTIYNTMDIQLEMINTNRLTAATLQKDVDAETERTGKKCTGSVQQ
ncbi:Lipase domain containing protein [Aphelenchoides fujianensis]|nr:Lipase domain containing protein [Aphelenchoides fujianensis]